MKKVGILVAVTAVLVAGILFWGMVNERDEVAVTAQPAHTQPLVHQVKTEAEVTESTPRGDGVRSIELRASVSAEDAKNMTAGDRAEITLRLAAEQKLYGRVRELEPQAQMTVQNGSIQDQTTVWIECETDTAAPNPGLMASVMIETNVKEQAVLVPFDCVLQQGNDYYVWVKQGGRACRRPVEIGEELQEWTEIKSGLSAEEEIVMNPPENVEGDSFPVREERGHEN